MSIRLRLYEKRYGHQRVIIHDGTRWRRLAEPWQITSARDAGQIRRIQQARRHGYPAPPMPEWVTTVAAPGYINIEVESIEYVA